MRQRVNISEKTAAELGERAREYKVDLSLLHAPYYINLASTDEEKQKNTIRYILQSLIAARWMGAARVVVTRGL